MYEGRDIMVLDVPNALIQTNMPQKKDGEERVIMKITGVVVYRILELDSDIYSNHVVFENIKKVIYVFVLREIYEMLVAALLFCNNIVRLNLSSILTVHVSLTGYILATNTQ